MRERLTKSEMAIMEILWEEGKGLTATEIVNIAGEKKTWKDSSIHLLINKLLDKGVIEVVGFRKTMKNYARTFFPVDSKQKYIVNQKRAMMKLDVLKEPLLSSVIFSLTHRQEESS